MTLAMSSRRSNSSISLPPPSRARTQRRSKRPGIRFQMQPNVGFTTSLTNMTPQTRKQMDMRLHGRRSGPKCIARYSRNRRRAGQAKGETYIKKLEAGAIPNQITAIFNKRMAFLDGNNDAQAKLGLEMWDILMGQQNTMEDVIKASLICDPSGVPAIITKDLTMIENAIDVDRCEHCESPDIYRCDASGYVSCESCGCVASYPVCKLETPFMDMASGKAKTSSTFGVTSVHIYDRMTHFKTLLNNIRGNGSRELDPAMLAMLRKKRVDTKQTIDHVWVISVLKGTKYSKFSPLAVRIARIVSDGEFVPRVIEMDVIQRLEDAFADVCRGFDEWIQTTDNARKNFMSYPYVACRIFERHGLSSLNEYVMKIKGLPTIKKQGVMWKQVCQRIGWE